MIIAWLSSLKNVRSEARMSPWLSCSRKSIQSGLSNVRCSAGTALARCRVASESAWRALYASEPGSSWARARSVSCPANACVGSVPGTPFWARMSVYCSPISGVATAR